MPNRPHASADGARGNTDLAPLPRLRPIKLSSLRAIRDEMGRVYREARQGRLPAREAVRLIYMLDRMKEITTAIEFEERLELLESLHHEANPKP